MKALITAIFFAIALIIVLPGCAATSAHAIGNSVAIGKTDTKVKELDLELTSMIEKLNTHKH